MEGCIIKALLTYGFGDMRLEDVPEPQVEPGCVKVRVEVCQPSVTDVLRFRGIRTGWLPEVRTVLETQAPFQLSGHEFCGEVVEVGMDVQGFEVGDRVSSRGDIPCGHCHRCREGDPDSCENKRRIGITYPGCFAEYVVIPALGLERISYDISGSEAACLQPLSSAVACVETPGITMGDIVVVIGQGVMGLYCAQIAAVSGASTVVGVDVRESMLGLARELGVDVPVDAGSQDPVSVVLELTSGRGADVVFECAGGPPGKGLAGSSALQQALDMVRNRGTVVQVAHPFVERGAPFDLSFIRKKRMRYVAPLPDDVRHFRHGFELVKHRRINISKVVSHVLDGLESVHEAFDITENKSKYGATGPAQVRIWRRE